MVRLQAQTDPLNHCDKVLERDIRNTYNVQTLNIYKGYLREILNYSHDQLKKYVSSHDSSITVPIPIAEVVLKAEASSSSTHDLLNILRTKYSSDLTLILNKQDFESVTSSVIDNSILDSWNQCIRDIGVQKDGIVYQVNGKENEIFSITFRYIPNEESDPEKLIITGLNVTGGGVKHIPTRIKDGTMLRRYTGYTQLFRRTETKRTINIQLDIKGRSGISIMVPGLKPQDLIPVGTIIPSVLPWPQFIQTVNDMAAYNPNVNKWAPCDARSIAGSELARLGGGTHTPDLRGMFIRGLNRFASDEPDPVSKKRQDPNTKRKVGSFQPENVGDHSHGFYQASRGGTTTADKGGDRKGLWHDGSPTNNTKTHSNPSGEVRPKNVAVFYYIKIN